MTDDFLLAPMKDSELRDLLEILEILEILEDRYDRTSTVINSQVPTKRWHELLADPTLADAICDRLVHNAHVITLLHRSHLLGETSLLFDLDVTTGQGEDVRSFGATATPRGSYRLPSASSSAFGETRTQISAQTTS